MEAERLEIKDKAPMVLAELLYDNNILNEIPKYRSLFLRVSCSRTCDIIIKYAKFKNSFMDCFLIIIIIIYFCCIPQFTTENPKAQKYLLGGFEQIVGVVYKNELMPKVPHILKQFYDCDILDEETLIEWDKKV